MGEWRLRVGFVQVPMPLIGATRHDEILSVSRSSDLAPFRLGTRYDRPLPRRLAEDMGVPREAFGQQKKAASMLFCHSLDLMSPQSRRDLEEFQRQHLSRLSGVGFILRQAVFDFRMAGMRFAIRLVRGIFNTDWPLMWRPQSVWKARGEDLSGLVARLFVGDYRVFEHASPVKSDLPFLWAVRKIRGRYAAGCPKSRP